MSLHAEFAQALQADQFACPEGLTAWNHSDPARRFAVYRNNVIVSLVEALADTYPVTQALVGEDFFRSMARLFARAQPPRSPVLAWYGAGFAEFIESFPPAASLPYLADVARVEFLRVQAYHAADAQALPREAIAALLAAEETLPEVRFALHPSLAVVRSVYPVHALWGAHQTDDPAAALANIDLGEAEAVLIVRCGLTVESVRIESGAAECVYNLQQGLPLGAAIARVSSEFDLAAMLGQLLQREAIVGV